MLVPSMNIQEIRKEIDKDYPVVFRKAGYMAHKIYRLFLPKKDKMVSRDFDYTSHNKNNWLYRVYIKNKKEFLQLMVYYYNAKGLCVYQVHPNSDHLLHYTSHFFHRYNERRRLNLIKPTDIIKAFMNDNNEYLIHKRKNIRPGVNKVFCLTDTGIILGTQDANEKVYHFNTFIPYTQLYKRQLSIIKKIFRYAQQTLQEAIKKQFSQNYLSEAA